MQTNSLDILEQSELPAGQARAILRVMEMEISSREEVLVTKGELKDAFHALELQIGAVRGAIDSLRGELRGEIKESAHALELKIERSEGRSARWVLTCTMGQAAMIAGAVYFALRHLR